MKTTLPDKLELRPLLFCIFLSICMSRSKPASKLSLTNLSFPVTVSPVLADYGAKYSGFFSSRSLKTREKYIRFAQFTYFGGSLFTFQSHHSKIHNYVKKKQKKNVIVNF